MRSIFGAVAMAAVLVACAPAAPVGPTAEEIAKASADLVAYLDAEYEEELLDSPQELTSQGRKERYGELDDRSEAAAERDLVWRRESVADMKAKFKPEALAELLIQFSNAPITLAKAASAAEALCLPDAASRLADVVTALIRDETSARVGTKSSSSSPSISTHTMKRGIV